MDFSHKKDLTIFFQNCITFGYLKLRLNFHVKKKLVNFFSDDLTALAELLALFGTKAVQETANQYGKRLISSEQVPGQDLQLLYQ